MYCGYTLINVFVGSISRFYQHKNCESIKWDLLILTQWTNNVVAKQSTLTSIKFLLAGAITFLFHNVSPSVISFSLVVRWQQGVHMVWRWPSLARLLREWWPSTETPRTQPSLRPSRRPSLIATLNALSLSRIWYAQGFGPPGGFQGETWITQLLKGW